MAEATQSDIPVAEYSSYSLFTSAWAVVVPPTDVSLNSNPTVTFEFPVSNEPEFGRALNPPVVFSTDTQPFALHLNFDSKADFDVYMILEVYGLPSTNPDGLTIDDAKIVAVIETTTPVWTTEGDGTFSVDLPFDIASSITDSNGDTYQMKDLTSSSIWNGYVSFVLKNADIFAPFLKFNSATLVSWTVPFNTGWLGHTAYRGRPVLDMKTGLPTFAQDCQEDGYYPGIWTEPKTWDAEEPMNIQPVELPDTEGELDDDYPQ